MSIAIYLRLDRLDISCSPPLTLIMSQAPPALTPTHPLLTTHSTHVAGTTGTHS